MSSLTYAGTNVTLLEGDLPVSARLKRTRPRCSVSAGSARWSPRSPRGEQAAGAVQGFHPLHGSGRPSETGCRSLHPDTRILR